MAPQAVDFLNPDFALAALSADQLGVFVRLVFSGKRDSPTARAIPGTATVPVSRPYEESCYRPPFCSTQIALGHDAGSRASISNDGVCRILRFKVVIEPLAADTPSRGTPFLERLPPLGIASPSV